MAGRRPEEVQRLFLAALKHQPNEYKSFLDEACADDAELRAEVESLLTHHGRAKAEGFAQERKTAN